MYDPGDASGLGIPPPPAGFSSSNSANPRYVYLLGRLRSRQITMEEATELFGLQQQMIRDAMSRPAAVPEAASSGAPRAPKAPAGSGLSVLPPMSDDGLAWSLLAIGTGAGILAAILKRAQGGPAPSAKRSP